MTDRGAGGTISIGDLASLAGVTTSALRFWEAEGLLPPVARTPSGYRRYDAEAQARVGFIRRAQALGLSLEEVGQLLRAADGEGGAPAWDQLRHLVAHKLDEARRQAGELDAFIGQLERVWQRLGNDDARCGCRHLGDCDCMDPALDRSAKVRLRAELRAAATCACGCAAMA
ncbi:MAG: MerR family transcriptional regulator [Acidimicrobiales bacterium]